MFFIEPAGGWEPDEGDDLPPTDRGPDGEDEPAYLLWPENWAPFRVFQDMASQWDIDAMGCRTGIRYPALIGHLQFTVRDDDARRQLYDDVRLMEAEAITEFRKAAEAAAEKAKQDAERERARVQR